MTVDDYIAAQPEASRDRLEAIRAAIRQAMPQAEECIAYHIPTYRLGGRNVLYFAGWKSHLALYPTSARMLEAMGEDLAPYRAAKDSLHFKLKAPLPIELIARVAAFRATEGYA